MICNEKLRKGLVRAVVFTVFFTALFIVLCVACLFIAENSFPVRYTNGIAYYET